MFFCFSDLVTFTDKIDWLEWRILLLRFAQPITAKQKIVHAKEGPVFSKSLLLSEGCRSISGID
jgi:hypothetical protein